MYNSVAEIVATAQERKLPIWELMLEQEIQYSRSSRTEVWNKMKRQLDVMKAAAKRGTTGDGVFSPTGLTGGEAAKMRKYRESGQGLTDETVLYAIENSLATNEDGGSRNIKSSLCARLKICA